MRLNKGLVAFVQVYMGHYWETIAGFNAESIAASYAKDCAESPNKVEGFYYRALGKRGKVLYNSYPAG